MVCAASIASRIERTVHSMLLTTPLRSPRHGTLPTPRMVMPSLSTSPTTALTLVVPRSSPTTISGDESELMRVGTVAVCRLLGRSFEARATLPCTPERGQVFARFPRSPHPHDDAIGMRPVIQENAAGHPAPAREPFDDAIPHQELSPPGSPREVQ